MSGRHSNHCRTISENLLGDRAVDEQTFASIAVLEERLGRLKKANKAFAGVEFSPHVDRIRERAEAFVVH